jgi:hypothetical protein
MKQHLQSVPIAAALKRSVLIAVAALFSMMSLAQLLSIQQAHAAQLSTRKVTVSTSQASATAVQYDFQFSWGTASDVEGAIFQFCTTPLGTCTLPTGMDVSNDLVTLDAHTGFPTNGTAFAEVAANTGQCNDTGAAATVTMYCIDRTEATSATGTNATVDLGAIINPSLSGAFTTVYVRVSLYDNNGFSNSGGAGNTKVFDGTVAAGITQQLSVNGRVQERLEFCVAAVDDGGATDTTLPVNCAGAPTTTTVDIGVIDNSTIVKSPVDTTTTNGSNDSYGIAMVNTNASGGVVIQYYPEQAAGTAELRNFRVPGATCAGAGSITDQCFNAALSTGTTFVAGTEDFGLNVPCIDTTQGTTSNLGSVPAAYSNTDATVTSSADCENTDAGVKFAWDNSGTAASLASSTTVVDDEIVKVSFGATAAPTTPTGSYTVVTTYIATPTF